MKYTLNGGETVYQGSWVPTVSCALIADEAIELLELIDQPSYWSEEDSEQTCATARERENK